MGYTFWFTGLPCSGKTTLSEEVRKILEEKNLHVTSLDGDDVRKGLCVDLGFSNEDRKENLRRIAEVAKLLNKNGNIVLASFVSPTKELRNMLKEKIGEDKFKLIYLECEIEVCELRDVKGMYKKAREGEIKGFTGIDVSFEKPENADLIINTKKLSLEKSVKKVINFIEEFI